MSRDFHLKLKLISEELKQCAAGGTKEQTLDAIDRAISCIESEFSWALGILEQLKMAREEVLPTLEEVQAMYRKQDNRNAPN